MSLSDFNRKQSGKEIAGAIVVESTVNQLQENLAAVGMAPTFIIAYVSPYLDIGQVGALIASRFPDVPKMICSTAGELVAREGRLYCEAERYWDRVVVQCFDSSIIAHAEVVGLPLGCEDIRRGKIESSLNERIQRLKNRISDLNVAMQIDHRDTLAYVLFDGLSASESFFMEALYDSERFPCLFVGGSAGGKLDFQHTRLHDGRHTFENHVLIAFLKTPPGIRFGIMKSQNFAAADVSFSILSASMEQRYVSQVIDKKGRIVSLVDALCDTFQCHPSALEALMAEYSFAISVGGELFVRSVSRIDTEMDMVHFYCDISPGEELLLVRKGDLVDNTIRDFKRFMDGKPGDPVAGILNDCILRRLLNHSQLPEMGDVLKGGAIAGFSTFGETLGLYLNQTLTGIFFFQVPEGRHFRDDYIDNFTIHYGTFRAFFLKRQIAKLNGLSQLVVRQIEDFKADRYGSRLASTEMDPTMATVVDGLNELGQALKVADAHRRLRTSQIEEQLSESERRFRLLAESPLTGIYLIQDDRFRYVNDAFAHMFGYSVNEIIGAFGSTDLVAPEDRRLAAENIRRRQAGEMQSMRYAFRALRKNGSIFHVEVYGRRITYKGKIGVIGILIDITEQKKAEEKLRASEERYRAFYNETPSMFFTIDDEGIITAVNDFGADQLGYGKTELLGNFFSNLFYEDDKDGACDEIESCLQTPGRILHQQFRMICKNGSQMWIEAFVRSVRGPKGNFNILAVCQDITKRKQLEESLRLTQFIFDKAPIGIWRMGPAGEVLDVNEQGCASLGYSREELCRMRVYDFAPEFGTEDWETYSVQLREAGTTTIEAQHQRRSGEIFPIQVIGKQMRFKGQAYHLAFVQEISERKQNEAALREKDQLLHDIGKLVKIGAWKFDLETGKATTTDEVARICDFEPFQDVDAQKVFECYHGVHRERMEHAYNELIEQGTPYDLELEIVSAKGIRKWVRSIGHPVMKDGRVVQVQGSFQDITDRKRMEEVLEKRVLALTQPLEDGQGISFEDLFNLSDIQHLQDLYAEAFGVAALITHPDGTPITKPSNFTYLCENLIRKTRKGTEKCKRSDAIIGGQKHNGPNIRPCLSSGLCDSGANISVGGHHIANWLIGQVRNELLDEEKIVAYAREIGVDEDEFRKAYHQVPFMPMEQFERAAQVVYTVAKQLSTMAYQNVQQARFISERKAAEEELRRLRNYLSNIINSMPSVLVGVDRAGRVTQWNKQAERATGLLSDQVATKPLNTVFPRLTDQMGRIQTAIRERRVITSPKVPRKHEQETRFEDITIFPLVANGVGGAVIRVDDVTEKVRIEEMMIQSEKMLSVGGLAAGMAHEVNNPLAGILQNASVLEKRLLGDLPANIKAAETAGTTLAAIRQYMELRKLPGMIENIRESGSRAAAIVRNMLSFARKSDRRVSTHDLGALLDQTLELVRTDYDMKKHYDVKQIHIERDYDPLAPPVPCEASKIQQVFMNILKNGAEAMAEVKDAPVPPAFVLRIKDDGDWVRMEIEDNGPGMDELIRRRIFEPFFTTKPAGQGTGLGLSVSYFIVTEDHGGEMVVQPVDGGGTRFVIRLPKAGGGR